MTLQTPNLPPSGGTAADPGGGGNSRRHAVASIQLLPLTPAELVWMENLREHLRPTGAQQLGLHELSSSFDSYSRKWHALPASHRWDPKYLTNSIGVSLGDVLISAQPGLHWIKAVKGGDSAIALRNDELMMTLFPLDAVGRRWASGELHWMEDWVRSVDRQSP